MTMVQNEDAQMLDLQRREQGTKRKAPGQIVEEIDDDRDQDDAAGVKRTRRAYALLNVDLNSVSLYNVLQVPYASATQTHESNYVQQVNDNAKALLTTYSNLFYDPNKPNIDEIKLQLIKSLIRLSRYILTNNAYREAYNSVYDTKRNVQQIYFRLRNLLQEVQLLADQLNTTKKIVDNFFKTKSTPIKGNNDLNVALVRWEVNNDNIVSVPMLQKQFSVYGTVNAVVMCMFSRGNALVDFAAQSALLNAIDNELVYSVREYTDKEFLETNRLLNNIVSKLNLVQRQLNNINDNILQTI
ncbi:DnaJ domain protein [Perigonia lusca single nucleopolyhedrovirus]|uniref:DnaJ domain protein n=1 Tax=Perigonia lusca single nucleopolyhedrovirus TaxID=1675865 RepID=A0A0M3N061_9ABAC|nr:DnaJ domain protein [Perigonia lusca single nucleopolyhedrovirus]AKN80639.1 DnaJ domain protein [Perigonia lusca single nucleopolyhedrovirus]